MSRYDAIVIGAGHNGLTAGAYLAKSGKKVCIVEKADVIGGMAQSRPMAGGVMVPRLAHLAYNLHPKMLSDLGLTNKIALKHIPTVLLAPDGQHIEITGQGAAFGDGTAHPGSCAFKELQDRLARFAQLLAPMALRPPPDLTAGLSLGGLGELSALGKLGLNLRRLGKSDMREFLRIVLSNASDVILDELPDGPLAGGLAADAIFGAWAGPRSPGTVFSLLYRYGLSSAAAVPSGGMSAVIDALANSARGFGADIRTQSGAQALVIKDDAVKGVVLEDGTTLEAKAVLSSLAPGLSMHLAGVEHFDTEAVRRVRHVRSKGMTAKVNLVLKEPLDIPGVDGNARFLAAPSVAAVEAAFNAAKYGRLPEAPVLECLFPQQNVLSVVAQYIPAELKGGWDDAARSALQARVIETLSAYMPGLGDFVAEAETLSPADIEAETGAPGGHWHHCELTTDQLLTVRPVNGMAHYRFALRGYYLCGAGAHPGGDVTGLPGRNSALQVMKDGVLS